MADQKNLTMGRRSFLGAAGSLAAAPLVEASFSPAAAQSPSAAGSAAPGRIPDKLVVGFVPSSDANALVDNIQPLADHLTTALGIPVEGLVADDYTGLVVAMGTQQADIGAFGPFALVQAADESGADIILQSVRNGATTYHSQWMTNKPETYCADAVVSMASVNARASDLISSPWLPFSAVRYQRTVRCRC